MNRWSPEKIRQVLLLAIGTAAVLGVIWLGAIAPLERRNEGKAQQVALVQNQIELVRRDMRMAEKYREEVRLGQRQIETLEQRMAQGDTYRWVSKYLDEMQKRHDVVVIDCDPPVETEIKAPPKVPYKAEKFTVTGNAYFHDFGAFLAALENSSPFIRVQNLTLQANAPGLASAVDPEKLAFRIEFNTLTARAPAPNP